MPASWRIKSLHILRNLMAGTNQLAEVAEHLPQVKVKVGSGHCECCKLRDRPETFQYRREDFLRELKELLDTYQVDNIWSYRERTRPSKRPDSFAMV